MLPVTVDDHFRCPFANFLPLSFCSFSLYMRITALQRKEKMIIEEVVMIDFWGFVQF